MTEPRARTRAKNTSIFPPKDLSEILYSFSDASPSLPSTISCLDEILTDFIIETCHAAALSASYSRRQKIKVDDFRWVLRNNPQFLGRVSEQLFREKHLRTQRKAMDIDGLEKEGKVGGGVLEDLADTAGVDTRKEKETGGRGGKGKKRKRKDEGGEGGEVGGKKKKTVDF